VIGKLIATGGQSEHWDGTNLKLRLQEEIADSIAALNFVIKHCGLDSEVITERMLAKHERFERWHELGATNQGVLRDSD